MDAATAAIGIVRKENATSTRTATSSAARGGQWELRRGSVVLLGVFILLRVLLRGELPPDGGVDDVEAAIALEGRRI
jgi:hypothetical protein